MLGDRHVDDSSTACCQNWIRELAELCGDFDAADHRILLSVPMVNST